MGGTNEVLVKEALMAAEEMGIDVGFIRMFDLDIKPCKSCMACVMSLFTGGAGQCSIKDDLAFVDEQVMESDGVIVSAPVYVLGPCGLIKDVADRWGPSHDRYWRMQAKKIAESKGKKGPDERSFKNRVGAIICTGGATTPHWLSFGLPGIHLLMFPSQIKVVDQMQVHPGRYPSMQTKPLVLNEEVLERAGKLGRNVAEAMKAPFDKIEWMGDEPGTCPVCHCNLLTVTNRNPVECPICGIKGEMKIINDEITVTFSEEEKLMSRLNIGGLKDHFDELTGGGDLDPDRMRNLMEEMMKSVNAEEFTKGKEKYMGYKEIKMKKMNLAEGPEGIYVITQSTPMGEMEATMAINSDGTGYIEGMMGKMEFAGAKIDGNNFEGSMTADTPMGKMEISFNGTVDGDNISGISKSPMGESPFIGQRK
jgi:multimeric flavodoxin WrbA